MKIIKDKPIYQCEYCGRVSINKGGMKIHEMNCKKNPENNIPCTLCEFLRKERKEIPDTAGQRCKICPNWSLEGNMCFASEDGYEKGCEGNFYQTDFICEKTGKRMYYEKKVLMMSKEKRESIISRCDCAMPTACEFKEDL